MNSEEQAPEISEPLKKCTDCAEEKPLSAFRCRRKTKPSYLMSYCKACAVVRNRRWKDENPEKAALVFRTSQLKRYNLTPAGYDALLAAQGGVCAICKAGEPGGKGNFRIDHDHACCPERMRSCGKCIRGLLCNYCNLHLAGENPRRLRAAAKYIEDFDRAMSVEQCPADGLMEPLFG